MECLIYFCFINETKWCFIGMKRGVPGPSFWGYYLDWTKRVCINTISILLYRFVVERVQIVAKASYVNYAMNKVLKRGIFYPNSWTIVIFTLIPKFL